MFRAMHAELYRLKKSKEVTIVLPAVVLGYILLFTVFDLLLDSFFDVQGGNATANLTYYPNLAALIISVVVTLFYQGDFLDGVIRNRVVVGMLKKHLYFSACIVMGIVAFGLQIFASLAGIAAGKIFIGEFSYSFKEMMYISLVYALAGVAIAVFFTTILFMLGYLKISTFLLPAIAFIMRVYTLSANMKMYPGDEPAVLTGFSGKMLFWMDEYVPFFHLTGFPRWSFCSYILGDLGLILVSLLIGVLVFRKKELR